MTDIYKFLTSCEYGRHLKTTLLLFQVHQWSEQTWIKFNHIIHWREKARRCKRWGFTSGSSYYWFASTSSAFIWIFTDVIKSKVLWALWNRVNGTQNDIIFYLCVFELRNGKTTSFVVKLFFPLSTCWFVVQNQHQLRWSIIYCLPQIVDGFFFLSPLSFGSIGLATFNTTDDDILMD